MFYNNAFSKNIMQSNKCLLKYNIEYQYKQIIEANVFSVCNVMLFIFCVPVFIQYIIINPKHDLVEKHIYVRH